MRFSWMIILLLAGCGGGGGETSLTDPIDDLPTVIDPEPDPSPTGTAAYRGPISLEFAPATAPQVAMEGTLALTVDFDASADAVTGDAAEFTTQAGAAVEGRLFLGGGTLDDSGAALLMNSQISGSLRSGTTGYLVFGQLNGEVQGNSQSAVSGSVSGSVRQSGVDTALSGQFAAGRLP